MNRHVRREYTALESAYIIEEMRKGVSVPQDPPEMRTIARMGKLGWDLDETRCMAKAKEVLDHAGVPETDYSDVNAVRRIHSVPLTLCKAASSAGFNPGGTSRHQYGRGS